ncbi:MAG: ATP-binding cassette domain-containing protein [Cyanobacteria bacterium P01_A01_bin.123]
MSDTQARSISPSTPLLIVEHLGRKLSGRWLWQGVTFALKPHMRLGLVGPSGSGKTLLLRALVRLDSCQAGTVSFAGKSLSQWSLPIYRTKVIYLPQRPSLFEGSVEQNLKMVFQLSAHRDRTYDRDRTLNDLAALNRRPEFLSLSAPQLSGGESQILGLLRALQLNPQVLLLDEPTASLDPETTTQVEALLNHWLQAAPDRACIWTSHDPNQIDRVTSKQLNLQQFIASHDN